MGRTIFHIDMNAFFASVEQAANPGLRGKPIAIVGGGSRTVITTASYEARAFGVKTGMAMWEGKQKCRHLIFVTADNRKYTHTSTEIMKILLEYTPQVEVCSVDEAFLDVTASHTLFGTPQAIAQTIKERIRERFSLTCSIGIAPNKLLAKLASDMKKPDGLTIIPEGKITEILAPLPIQDLCGVGGKMQRHLNLLGIMTCGDLARFPVEVLRKKFGILGDRLQLMARGVDDAPVVPGEEAPEVKSIGHGNTLDRDATERGEIISEVLRLSEMVGRRARKHGVWGKTVTVAIRFADFDTNISRQETWSNYTNDSQEIYRRALDILDTLTLPQPVRLIEVRLSNLRYQSDQLPLFDQNKRAVTDAMDSINNRHGDFTVTFGSLLGNTYPSRVIPPAWRPNGPRAIDVE